MPPLGFLDFPGTGSTVFEQAALGGRRSQASYHS